MVSEFSILSGQEFFTALESKLNAKIHPYLKNVLSLIGVDTAGVFKDFITSFFTKMERFMRSSFSVELLDEDTNDPKDYYENFRNIPKKFAIVCGHRQLLTNAAEICSQTLKEEGRNAAEIVGEKSDSEEDGEDSCVRDLFSKITNFIRSRSSNEPEYINKKTWQIEVNYITNKKLKN